MRKYLGFYLIALGVLEIAFCEMREIIPLTVLPHIGLLWLPTFLHSQILSICFVLLMTFLFVNAGAGLLKNRRQAVFLYCVIGALVLFVDLVLPVTVLLRGGAHVLRTEDAWIILLVALFYDVIPVSFSAWQLMQAAKARDSLPAHV